jgi:hypothetical protein
MGALAPLAEVIPEVAAVSANLRREAAHAAE